MDLMSRCNLYKWIYMLKLKSNHYPVKLSRRFDKVIFIAHPDDEVIFFGSHLQNDSGWLVVCMTNGDHPIRQQEFIRSMDLLKCNYIMWKHPDGLDVVWNEASVSRGLANVLRMNHHWQKILTHNAEGEYGHPQHMQLHHLVKDAVKGQSLLVPVSRHSFSGLSPLPIQEQQAKIQLLVQLYPSQQYVLDEHREYFEFESFETINSN